MPSSYSTSLRFELQFTGENVNSWGIKLSNTLQRVDDAIAGYVAISISGNYSLSSSNDNTAADEARKAHLKFTGSPAANFSITVPSVSKSYWTWNSTAKIATVTTGGGGAATVDAGDIEPVWTDGTNVKQITFNGLRLKDYINAQTLAATGSLPAAPGNAGKFLYCDGTNWLPRQPQTTDLGDYAQNVLGAQIALAVAL